MTHTFAVVPSRDRDDCLRECIASLDPQTDGVVVINNGDPARADWITKTPGVLVVIQDGQQPPNLSNLLNQGIEQVETLAKVSELTAWNVALLNDDAEVPPGWVDLLGSAMRDSAAAAAYVDRVGRAGRHLSRTPPADASQLMTCWACLVRGELGLRWDEDLRWWFGDNLFDLACRKSGGVVAVGGALPLHKHPSAATMASVELSEQARRDEQTYRAKIQQGGWL